MSAILLATSNGAGMGHLARQSSVALALRQHASPTIFSLSTAVHVVSRHGLPAEYCPSHHRGWMPHLLWHRYLGARVRALLEETGARVFAFDGVAPYLGLLRIRAAHPQVAFVWVRRGLWRANANRRLLSAEAFFDDVVEPGELAAQADRGPTAATAAARIAPISLTSEVNQLSREEAARDLGLDPARPTALITLGAGTINDALTPATAAILEFLVDKEWQVAATRAPLARSALPDKDPRVRELVGVYPMARYLAAFDAAVSAAGYNAVHELLPAQVPTLLVPNAATATDDQIARAQWAANNGVALCAEESPAAVAEGVRSLLDPKCRTALRNACADLPSATGAADLAERLAQLADSFAGHRRATPERLRSGELLVKSAGMQILGDTGVSAMRKALGRNPPPDGPRQPLAVRPLITEDLDPDALRAGHPVEHLLAGSSPAYRNLRLAIAHRAYRWSS